MDLAAGSDIPLDLYLCEVIYEGEKKKNDPEVITLEDNFVVPNLEPIQICIPEFEKTQIVKSNIAWGSMDYTILNASEEDDKEALHRILGIKNKVQPALREFIVSKTMRKRGRPPKRPKLEGGVLDNENSADIKIEIKKEPTKEEVQAYLQSLRVQVAEERKGQVKRQGRPMKFDISREVNKSRKLEKQEENDVKKEPRKRGRPPNPNKPVKIIPQEKRKRGRPPKPRTLEDLIPKVAKRRGRPPKPKTAEDLLPKIPKKRGRPRKVIALEDLGVQVIYGDDNNKSTPIPAEKPKMIYTFERDPNKPDEVDQSEILNMISSGLLVVDVTDTGKSLPKRRGRPPFDPNRPPSTPKIPGPPRLSERGRILGRPRKGSERPIIVEPIEKKQRGRPKKPILETEKKEAKKRGRPKKVLDDSLRATPQQIYNIKVMKQWTTKYRSKNYVPSYMARVIYNCCWCRQWSWDIKICSHCCRSVPGGCQLLTIEEHEVIDDNTDTTRPFFHPPPLPYVHPGFVVLCSGCFYYTPVSESKCVECGLDIPKNATLLHVEFSADKAPPDSKVVPFTPRLIEDDWIECPHCGLSLSKRADSCTHCHGLIPKHCYIAVMQKSNDAQQWPSEKMLEDGFIEEPQLGYVPLFKKGRVAMCRWCCTWVWDFNRCNKCLRKLPPTTDLLLDGPSYDYVDGEEAKRPSYSALPVPYLRPGIMAICPLCKNYSKNMKHCDGCLKRMTHDPELVDVSFESRDPTESPGDRETILPYITRTVNYVYAVCPHCEFSTPDFDKCENCSKLIPSHVVVRPASDVMFKKPKAEVQTLNFKPRSIFYSEETLTGKYQPVQDVIKYKRSPTYIPRYREHGIAQCSNCLMWTWDFNQCSNCFAPVQNISTLPPVVYNTVGFKDKKMIEAARPKFAPPPVPYLRSGRVVFCKSCFSCTVGPPICIICDKEFDNNPLFVFVNFKWNSASTTPVNSQLVQFQPRTTANGNLCLCPFCGFTTQDLKKCSYCNTKIPKTCLVSAKSIDELKPMLDLIRKNDIDELNKTREDISTVSTKTVNDIKAQENIPIIEKKKKEKQVEKSKVILKPPTLNPTNSAVKVISLKPVPTPKIPPKNVIKINTNQNINIPNRLPNSLVPLALQGPVHTNLIEFPTFEPPVQQPKKLGVLYKMSSILATANSKLQAGLVAAGLISTPIKPNVPVPSSEFDLDISDVPNV